KAQDQLGVLASRQKRLEQEQAKLDQKASEQGKTSETIALTSAELRQRSLKLAEEIRALENMPVPRKTLRYRTPVSRPVQSEELFFECHQGRVAFIDVAALLLDIREHLEEKGKALHDHWQVTDTT